MESLTVYHTIPHPGIQGNLNSYYSQQVCGVSRELGGRGRGAQASRRWFCHPQLCHFEEAIFCLHLCIWEVGIELSLRFLQGLKEVIYTKPFAQPGVSSGLMSFFMVWGTGGAAAQRLERGWAHAGKAFRAHGGVWIEFGRPREPLEASVRRVHGSCLG